MRPSGTRRADGPGSRQGRLLAAKVAALPLVATTTVFVLLAATSYGAAIASARGYCATLREMDTAETQPATPAAS